MRKKLLSIRKQYTGLITFTFLITPVLGIWCAVFFGLAEWREILQILKQGSLPVFLTAMLAWVGIHFHDFLNNVLRQMDPATADKNAQQKMHEYLSHFSLDYWGIFLVYAIVAPAVIFISGNHILSANDMRSYAIFTLLQLCITILVGLPTYFLSLNKLSRLVSKAGMVCVQNSIKSKLILLGGFVPLLSYSLLIEYLWLQNGKLPTQVLLVWLALSIITILLTTISVRSLKRSLQPVQKVLERSGAVTHKDLAKLQSRSTDEIGYLTQSLGDVFQRLVDQESHIHAVVDNAAEGIITTDESGEIDTFNIAAEKLFGYQAHEVRGKLISWLLPELVDSNGTPVTSEIEIEIDGKHRDGHTISASIGISEIKLSNKHMFVYLVEDITDKKKAKAKQKNAEMRFRDLVETAHDLVWTMDTEGNWTYLNNASVNIYGYSPDEMIGRPVSDFQTPEFSTQESGAFAEILNGKELLQFETVHANSAGEPVHLSFNAKAQRDDEGKILRITGSARDITEKKVYEKKLTYQAEHDELTGLYNRRYFQQELERVIARVTRSAATCAILYVDLDQFKYINDTLGHAAGDRLLTEISEMLTEHVREGDLLARFGGDEFTLLLYNIDDNNVVRVANEFRKLLENYKFMDNNNSFNISCSIGAAVVDGETGNAEEALSHADLACNIAKSQGRNRVNLYDPIERDKDGMAEDMGWATRVRDMLDNDRFLLLYQPIISMMEEDIHSYEVLMRMPCDDGQVILPGGFMPAAERFGLIHNVDRWIVHHAIMKLAELHEQEHPVRFSINLSGHAFHDPSLLPLIRDMFRSTNLDPSLITFEIAETAAITNLKAAVQFIHKLKDIGCQFSLDDFGSGFCSFTYLKNLPVDKLKIDGAFIRKMAQSPVDQAMVQSMNQVAHALGKVTVAESVEDGETLELLKKYNVDYAQGHYFGSPIETLSGSEVLHHFSHQDRFSNIS
ncbi:MAG: EAL domain-containing protein [Gammaproteobacteria bacterium]|nr:EAL domain-containing protein [Gammaproteobacteria bacterium]